MKFGSKIISCIMAAMLMLMCAIPTLAAETSNEISATSTANNYNEVIQMTNEHALEYFKEFLASQSSPTTVADVSITQDTLEAFTRYAVEEGIIADTAEQRGAITKAIVRAEFAIVVAGGDVAGFDTAADLLEHSLQDYPDDLSYGYTSSYAQQILNSSECQSIISDFKAYVTGKNLNARTTSGSKTLNSTTDLHLAYNKVSYYATGIKNNGVWTLTIKFRDTYDFQKQAWENAMTDNIVVTALNNYAAYAQDIGAIVPYDITVTIRTTFTE